MSKGLKEHPDHVAGFDLVGDEDYGVTLERHLATFLKHTRVEELEGGDQKLKSTIPFFLHTAETSWNDEFHLKHINSPHDITPRLYNLYSFFILSAQRVGHGLGFWKHPYLMHLLQQQKTPVEVCVLSNKMLGYTPDLRQHPGQLLHKLGLPVILSPDDPGLFGYNEVSVDWYHVLMGWGGIGLEDFYLFGLNSLTASTMTEEQQVHAIEKVFKPAWESYVATLVLEACGRVQEEISKTARIEKVFPDTVLSSSESVLHVSSFDVHQAMCSRIVCAYELVECSGGGVGKEEEEKGRMQNMEEDGEWVEEMEEKENGRGKMRKEGDRVKKRWVTEGEYISNQHLLCPPPPSSALLSSHDVTFCHPHTHHIPSESFNGKNPSNGKPSEKTLTFDQRHFSFRHVFKHRFHQWYQHRVSLDDHSANRPHQPNHPPQPNHPHQPNQQHQPNHLQPKHHQPNHQHQPNHLQPKHHRPNHHHQNNYHQHLKQHQFNRPQTNHHQPNHHQTNHHHQPNHHQQPPRCTFKLRVGYEIQRKDGTKHLKWMNNPQKIAYIFDDLKKNKNFSAQKNNSPPLISSFVFLLSCIPWLHF